MGTPVTSELGWSSKAQDLQIVDSNVASLWAGDGAVIGGLAAAHLWKQVPDLPPTIEVIVDLTLHRRSRAGIRVVRRRPRPHQILNFDGMRVLDQPSALVKALVALGGNGADQLDRQLQLQHTLPEIKRHLDLRSGSPGVAAARVLVERAGDGAAAESERRCRRLLQSHGITGWVANPTVPVSGHPYQLDLAFLPERIAIEIDGWAWHVTPDRFQGDRERQNALLLDGWIVLHFTWRDLIDHPERVVRQVMTALARRRR